MPLVRPPESASMDCPAHGNVELVDGVGAVESPMGRVTLEFAPSNPFGVLDHQVTLPSGEKVNNPMRVTPNADGCDVVFTVRRRGAGEIKRFRLATGAAPNGNGRNGSTESWATLRQQPLRTAYSCVATTSDHR